MKRTFLLLLLTAAIVLSATFLSADYFVNFEGAGEVKTAYASGTVNLSGLNWDMTESLIGTLEADWKNGTRSARFRGYAASSMTMLEDKPNGLGTISFYYRRYGTDLQVDWKVEYSSDGGTTWTQIGQPFTAPASDDVQLFSEVVNVQGGVRIRIKRATEEGTTNKRLNIDDILVTDYSDVSTVATPTFNPPAGTYYETQFVTIETTTPNATIYYTLNGDDPNEFSTQYTGPVTISETTTLKAKAYALGYDPSFIATALYRFPIEVATIAELRTHAGDGLVYRLTGGAVVTLQGSYRNQRFIQDDTAGILIDDVNIVIPPAAYNIGDVVEDLTGTVSIFNNMVQLVPTINSGVVVNTGVYPTPITVTIPNIDSSLQGMLIKVNNLTYGGAPGNFASGQNYLFNDASSNQITLRTTFPELDYIGDPIPVTTQNLTGVYAVYQTTLQITPRSWDDFEEVGGPLLQVNPANLTGFTYVIDAGPSASQNYQLSGLNLSPASGNIVVTGSDNFQVSLDDVNFAGSVNVPYSDGALAATPVYVRLISGLPIGVYAEQTITNVGGGDSKIVTVSGEVTDVPPPGAGLPYYQIFDTFDYVLNTEIINYGEVDEWYFSSTGTHATRLQYMGDWGSGTSTGFRGNDNVIGYQHSSTSGIITYTLTLNNDTGSTLNEIYVSYLARVARATEERSPEWTVRLNGVEIPELFYSTIVGIDQIKATMITGLSIPVEENFTISWSSDRGLPAGSSRQIGISQVFVGTEIPLFLMADPLALSDLNYVEGFGPSTAQSFELYGMNLNGSNVVVTAPTNFAVSVDNISFASEVSLVAFDGAATDIWVQLIAGLGVDNYAGDVGITGGGADPILVSLSGSVIEAIDDFAIPYNNPFRTQEDYDRAIFQEFVIEDALQELGAGGYLRINPAGYLESPTIDFTEYDFLDVLFDGTTYGGVLGQTLTVMVSADNGLTYNLVESYLLTGVYETYSTFIDLTSIYNSTTGKIKIEMTDGTGSSRLRDYYIGIDYYGSVEGLAGMALWNGLTTLLLDGHLNYTYDAARFYMHGYIDNIDGQVRCIYTGQWVEHPYGTLSTPPEFSAEHTYAQSWFEADLDATGISFAVSDLHALHPARLDVNSARSNSPFDYVTNIYTIWGSDSYLSYTGFNAELEQVFDVADEFKGNLARGILYFATRYYGSNDNFYRLNVDQLPILLQWHYEDPVDAREIARNQLVFEYQGNRNPFIDRPEFVELIWGEITPEAPVAILPTDINFSSFTANWAEVVGTVTYRLDVSTSPSFVGFVTGYKNRIVNSTSQTVTGLDELTTYYYRVRALDAQGNLSPNPNTIYATTDYTPIAADLIYYWNFNLDVPASGVNWTQPIPANIGTASISYTFTQAVSFVGTTINGIVGEENGGSLSPLGGTDNVNNGEHFTMYIPTTGYENIVLSYPTRRTSTGFNTQEIKYTVDGENWLTKEIIDITTFENNWVLGQLILVDFTETAGVNDNPDFAIRIVLNGVSGATGNNRFDNIQILGHPITGELLAPENVLISISDSDVIISWDAVTGASTYIIEASSDPYGVFSNVTAQGILDGTTWTGTISDDMKFYRVIAVQ